MQLILVLPGKPTFICVSILIVRCVHTHVCIHCMCIHLCLYLDYELRAQVILTDQLFPKPAASHCMASSLDQAQCNVGIVCKKTSGLEGQTPYFVYAFECSQICPGYV